MKALGLVLALLPAPALAQAYQCTLPRDVGPVRPVTPDGPVRKLPIAGYTLAASWSPDYCKTSGDTRSMQCAKASGRFGFVLHGLWPEGARGTWPQWCGTTPALSPALLRQHLCMTPSAQLLSHEWAKHGSCMAKTPESYFRTAARLWDVIWWPDADRLSRKKGLTAGDLRDAFVASNPAVKRESVSVQLSRTGWLTGINLCYGRSLQTVKCPAGKSGATDLKPMKIWRGL